jgi:hypothetical protein
MKIKLSVPWKDIDALLLLEFEGTKEEFYEMKIPQLLEGFRDGAAKRKQE